MQLPGLGTCLNNKETSSYSKQDEAPCVGHELIQQCLCVGRLLARGQEVIQEKAAVLKGYFRGTPSSAVTCAAHRQR